MRDEQKLTASRHHSLHPQRTTSPLLYRSHTTTRSSDQDLKAPPSASPNHDSRSSPCLRTPRTPVQPTRWKSCLLSEHPPASLVSASTSFQTRRSSKVCAFQDHSMHFARSCPIHTIYHGGTLLALLVLVLWPSPWTTGLRIKTRARVSSLLPFYNDLFVVVVHQNSIALSAACLEEFLHHYALPLRTALRPSRHTYARMGSGRISSGGSTKSSALKSCFTSKVVRMSLTQSV